MFIVEWDHFVRQQTMAMQKIVLSEVSSLKVIAGAQMCTTDMVEYKIGLIFGGPGGAPPPLGFSLLPP